MRDYVICCDADNGQGLVTHVLQPDKVFALATSRVMRFSGPRAAAEWWSNNSYSTIDPPHRLGDWTRFYCRGPRGGVHSLCRGI